MDPAPPVQPSLKRKADTISPDPSTSSPSTKSVRLVAAKHPYSSAGPVLDPATWDRGTVIYNRILTARTQQIKDRIAAENASLYNHTDLVANQGLFRDMIMEGIKNALVWNDAFEVGLESQFLVTLNYNPKPKPIQVLRALFPGLGKIDQKGREHGWRMNEYKVEQFQEIMGTDLIARVGSSFAELRGLVKVFCPLDEGCIKFAGEYRELVYPPEMSFPKTQARKGLATNLREEIMESD